MPSPLLSDFSRAVGLTGPLELVVTRPDSERSERLPLNQPFALIGRASQNDLTLEDPSVSRRHAFLQAVGDRAAVVDLGSRTGVRWPNGPRRAGWLAPGETVRIGEFEVRLESCPGPVVDPTDESDPLAARPTTTPLTDLTLEVDPGTGRTTIFPMPQWVAIAGRAGVCTVRRPTKASCRTARSCGKSDRPCLIDMLATAGRVNGKAVRAARAAGREPVGPAP